MPTVTQPGFAPTNKLTAVMIAGVAYEFMQPVLLAGVEWVGRTIGIEWTLGPNGDMLVQFGIMFLAGYLIKDRPNV